MLRTVNGAWIDRRTRACSGSSSSTTVVAPVSPACRLASRSMSTTSDGLALREIARHRWSRSTRLTSSKRVTNQPQSRLRPVHGSASRNPVLVVRPRIEARLERIEGDRAHPLELLDVRRVRSSEHRIAHAPGSSRRSARSAGGSRSRRPDRVDHPCGDLLDRRVVEHDAPIGEVLLEGLDRRRLPRRLTRVPVVRRPIPPRREQPGAEDLRSRESTDTDTEDPTACSCA